MFSRRKLMVTIFATFIIVAGVTVYMTVIYEKPLGPPSGYDYDHVTILEGPVTEEWVVHYNPRTNDDWANDMAIDNKGNVYVTGRCGEDTVGQDDFVTVKYNGSGSLLWVARYDGPVRGSDEAVAIAVDSRDNVYVTGWSEGKDDWADFATVKYDTEGNQLWVARYESPGSDSPASTESSKSLVVDKADNIYVIGRSSGDYLTIKYDSAGNELWTVRYPGTGDEVFPGARSIAVGESGNVYVAGETGIVKYDSDGQEVWAIPGGDSMWYGIAIAIDGEENIYVGGAGIEKYDTDGNLLWKDLYNSPIDTINMLRAISLDNFENVYLTGWFEQGIDGDTVKGETTATLKYDTDGNRLWTAYYDCLRCPDYVTRSIIVDSSSNGICQWRS